MLSLLLLLPLIFVLSITLLVILAESSDGANGGRNDLKDDDDLGVFVFAVAAADVVATG